MGDIYSQLRDAIRGETPVALATVVEGTGVGSKLLVFAGGRPEGDAGGLGNEGLDRVVARDARGELEAGRTIVRHYGPNGEARREEIAVFIESFTTRPRMIVFGAVDFTASLVEVARILGFRTIVCDARAVFATEARFPAADEVVVDWPDKYLAKVGASLGSRDAICVLTHDHKFDVPAIVGALATNVGYIGCMGARRTHAERVERLRKVGVDDEALARVRAPIGLDIGAKTPAETAIAIVAEIIANAAGKRAPSLSGSNGPIHPQR